MRRLVPLNALIAFATSGDVYLAPLARSGYRLSGIEIPVATTTGKVVIDAVLFRPDRNIVLVAEAKSGANIDEEQARKYGDLASDDVVRASSITIREPGDRQLQVLYVCLAENLDRVRHGLDDAGLNCPVLAIGEDRIEHHAAGFVDSNLDAAFAQPIRDVGAPPRIVPVDDESPDDAFDKLVLQALVATLSQQRQSHQTISVPALAELAIPHLAVYGKAARNRLVDKIGGAARRAADRDPETFEYGSRTATRDYAVVRSLRSPEEADRRGRTQVYQSIARAAKRPPRRRGPSPDQMALFDDLIEEHEQADEVAGAGDATHDEEEGQ